MKTQTQILAARIESIVSFFATRLASAPRKAGSDALAHSLGLPDTQHVAVLLQSGRLKPIQLHRNAPQTGLFFSAKELTEVRREVLRGIAEQVIEQYTGAPSELPAAVHAALSDYVKSLEDGTASAKGFTRADTARARSFAAYGREEDRPGLLRRGATIAGTVGAAGAAYGGLSYLRGRMAGARGFIPALKAGNAANVADLRKAGSRVAGFIRPRPTA